MTAATTNGVDWARIDAAVGKGVRGKPLHPGEVLIDLLDEFGLRQTDLARASGWTVKHVNQICKGRVRLTAGMAFDLQSMFGIDARVWLHIQSAWDLHHLDRPVLPLIRPSLSILGLSSTIEVGYQEAKRLVEDGAIPSHTVGTQHRVYVDDVDRYQSALAGR